MKTIDDAFLGEDVISQKAMQETIKRNLQEDALEDYVKLENHIRNESTYSKPTELGEMSYIKKKFNLTDTMIENYKIKNNKQYNLFGGTYS